jgi:radical SAM superfamily enzyme YgiQ (UPF0313 family)
MRILLIQPAYRTSELPTYFPLGLAYIAAVLRNAGHEIKVIDIEGSRYPPEEVARLLSTLEYDAVGISALITRYKYLKRELIPLIRAKKPGVPIVVGNSMATAIPKMTITHAGADIAVIDEGEVTAVELFNALAKGWDEEALAKIDGMAFRKKDGSVAVNTPRAFIQNLDTIPFPAWDLFPTEEYTQNLPLQHAMFLDVFKPLRGINVSTVRGCPFQCRYCFKVFGRNVRWRSVDNIVEEIKELQKRYGVQYISFSDDLFTVNRTRVEEFCNRLIKENLGVNFLISARVNTVDEPLLKLLAKAGVVSLSYGIESANNDVLKSMNKMATKEMAHKAMMAAKKAGIFANPSFMIGYPGETPQSIEETVRFCEELGVATEFFYTTAYPGTPLYDQARAMGKIPDEDAYFESLGEMTKNLLINFTEMSDEDLRRLKEEGNRRTRESQLGKLITIGKTLGPGKMVNALITRAICKAIRTAKQRGFVGNRIVTAPSPGMETGQNGPQ